MRKFLRVPGILWMAATLSFFTLVVAPWTTKAAFCDVSEAIINNQYCVAVYCRETTSDPWVLVYAEWTPLVQ
jgi:hypothetical protein